jgi:ubiquinone/menaquinone biosynthesis C-methylase UbiE
LEKISSDLATSHHRFDDVQHWVKVFDDPTRDAWQKPTEVVAKMAIKAGMTIADLGAGTGYFIPYLDKAVGSTGKVLALDVETNLVGYLQQRIAQEKLLSSEARLIALDSPQLNAESVDKILIVDTWHHIDHRLVYVSQLKKALKENGEIWVVDFEPGTGGPGPRPEHRLSPQVVIQELQSAGLKTELIEESLPYQYIVRARKK